LRSPLPSEHLKILKPVRQFAKARKLDLYLVGGILRDVLLGRFKQNPDIDFCLKKGAINFGRALCARLKCGFVVLDKEHGACRLVKIIEDKTYTLDFTDFRGRDLKDDLLHRDFTINALALKLDKVFSLKNIEEEIIDPYSGIKDLRKKIIKVVCNAAFTEDPLRILRAFSLSCVLGFKIDNGTLRLAQRLRHKLTGVSFERIRDELFKIMETPLAFDFLSRMDELKILEVIFPEIKEMRGVNQGPYHHLDIWGHSLETLKQLENLTPKFKANKDIQNYLNKIISSNHSRLALIKLAAILHDIGKPSALRKKNGKLIFHGHDRLGAFKTEEIARRLKLSVDEINALRKIVLMHLRPGFLADSPILTSRAKFRFFRDTGIEAVSVVLISLADQRSTRGRLTTKDSRERHEKACGILIREYFKKQKEKKLPRLITGDDLLKKFKLEPSPLIGKILSEIEELQAIGKISAKAQALEAAKRIISKERK
jgi:poly(A) polymerase